MNSLTVTDKINNTKKIIFTRFCECLNPDEAGQEGFVDKEFNELTEDVKNAWEDLACFIVHDGLNPNNTEN
jgi:hypothetical protein